MYELILFMCPISIKKVTVASVRDIYGFYMASPVYDQVEGVLDGVTLSWSHQVITAGGVSGALWLLLPLLLFTVGVVGVGLTQSNFLRLLVALELLLLGVNLNFILFAAFFTAAWGQVFALLIVAVGAAEAAIGLAILIALYRVRGTITLRYFHLLRG